MFKRIDESRWLAERIASLSEFMAKRRGLPVIIGICLVIVSFVIQIINVYTNSQIADLAAVILLNVGILTALIGLLLADPLGK
jgi:hypothetical protein